jgi:hypothetical protein
MTPMSQRFATSRRAAVLMAVGLMVLITVPAALALWSAWRLDAVGVTTEATVTDTHAVPKDDPERWFVRYRLSDDADSGQPQYIARISQAEWDEARESGTIEATYLLEKPGTNRVEGQVSNRLALWLTVLADLALVGLLVLALKFRPARTRPLVLLATADVVRARPGFSVEEEGAEVVVRGEVLRIDGGEIVLSVGPDREVRVVLGEYRNPVGYQQPAEVRGRRIEP